MNSEHLIHLWTIAIAALASMSCSSLGTFLFLRRSTMIGDTLSHAILPGIALGFLVSGSRELPYMFTGALVAALLSAWLVYWGSERFQLDRSAVLGIVSTVFFAIGLILIRVAADRTDLDADCVLSGLLEFAVLDTVAWGEIEVPRGAVVLSTVLLVNLGFCGLFWKELVLSSFDPESARLLGINTRRLSTALLGLVALTCVATFEVVGTVLVLSLFVLPVASARLVCRSTAATFFVATVLAAALAPVGYFAAVATNTTSAGMISLVHGSAFLALLFLAPQNGLIAAISSRIWLDQRIRAEDFVAALYRQTVDNSPPSQIRQPLLTPLFLRLLGYIKSDNGRYNLTPRGNQLGQTLVRSHRLWERYLVDHAGAKPESVHMTAETLEHFTDRSLRDELAEISRSTNLDPHGKNIPPEQEKS